MRLADLFIPLDSSRLRERRHKPTLIETDAIVRHLIRENWEVGEPDAEGHLPIRCPFDAEHSTPNQPIGTDTVYMLPHYRGNDSGRFHCLHAHCEGRSQEAFLSAVQYIPDGFADLTRDEGGMVKDGGEIGNDRPRFASTPISELALRPPQPWVVDGVLPKAALVVVFGESGSGKSFIAWDLCAAIATGREWRSRAVSPGAVVWVALEGRDGLPGRVRAYTVLHSAGGQFRIVERDAPNLLLPADAKALAAQIVAEGGADVVVVDTAARAMPGGDEGAEDMGTLIRCCDHIHRATGAVVVLIHHAGKDATKGARGHSSLRAAADAELEVVRNGDDRALIVTKQKDGEDGAQFGFRLRVVDVGDGRTSCVVEHGDDTAPRKSPRLGVKQQLVLRVATEMGELSEEGAPVNRVIEACVDQMVRGEGKNDNRRYHASRALEALTALGIVQVKDGFVQVAESPISPTHPK